SRLNFETKPRPTTHMIVQPTQWASGNTPTTPLAIRPWSSGAANSQLKTPSPALLWLFWWTNQAIGRQRRGVSLLHKGWDREAAASAGFSGLGLVMGLPGCGDPVPFEPAGAQASIVGLASPIE
ncbi:hypothetical protein RJZ57_005680, partial [Blastomyces gilchristii]